MLRFTGKKQLQVLPLKSEIVMKTIQLKDALQREISQWDETGKVSSILSIDSTGTGQTISPANLLKAQRKGLVPSSGYNNIIDEGCYNITNAPNKPDIEYGILCVANTGDFVVQYAFEMFAPYRIFFRMRNEKYHWNSWVSFSHT